MKKVFISYGRADASGLADRLAEDLAGHGIVGVAHYEPWKDRDEIRAGGAWTEQLATALNGTDVVLAILTPAAVRTKADGRSTTDSVCLDEISWARFQAKKPILPVMASACTPPFEIFRLDYVDLTKWQDPAAYASGLQRLLEGLEAVLRGTWGNRATPDQLSPWDFGDFLEQKRQGFTGRGWLFKEISEQVAQRTQPAILIIGGPGSGKSAILAEYVHRNPDGRVLAFHCCQAATPETINASRFVRGLAGLIASRHPAYEALVQQAPYRDVLSERASNQDPASAFDEGILAALAKAGPPEAGAWTIAIDALDESMRQCADGKPTIAQLLADRLDRLPSWLTVIATSRPEKSLLDLFGSVNPVRLEASELQNNTDLRELARARLAAPALGTILADSGQTANWCVQKIADAAKGNFLYAEQTLAGLERKLIAVDDLGKLPPGLSQQYRLFFHRQFADAASWQCVRPIFAALAAAQEPLPEAELAVATGITPATELATRLRSVTSYLRSTSKPEPRHSIFHSSLHEWFADEASQGGPYAIAVAEGDRLLADGLFAAFEADRFSTRPYALAHLGHHLGEVARTVAMPEKPAAHDRLVRFCLDPAIASMRIDDPFGLDTTLQRALRTVADSGIPESAAKATRLALGLTTFRRERLDANRIFKLAANGQVAQAEKELQLYEADNDWQDAARLVIAWLGRTQDPLAADSLRQLARRPPQLAERVDAAFEQRKPVVQSITESVGEDSINEIFNRVGGGDDERVNPSMLWDQSAPPPTRGQRDVEGTRYQAEFDAPKLVAFAQVDALVGDARLRDYLALQATNAYRVYRNGSLWEILLAAARHTKQEWVLEMMQPILTAALAGAGREFGAAGPIAVMGCRALEDPAQRSLLDALQAQALQALGGLARERGRGDSWGEHRRTLCALAEVRQLVLNDSGFALAEKAFRLPTGYAGFQAPANLTVAETLSLCGAPAPKIDDVLHSVYGAAHNVQDLVFCARTVSRVHALVRNWWPQVGKGEAWLPGTIDRFVRDPHAAEFCAVHVIGEMYTTRRVVNPTSRLPAWLLAARSLEALARAYQWRLADWQRVNGEIGAPDQQLPDNVLVRVPDPRWAPLLAAFFSSRVIASKLFTPPEKVRFILRLVPLAVTNRTALDTVLARLIMAARPTQPATLANLDESFTTYAIPEIAAAPFADGTRADLMTFGIPASASAAYLPMASGFSGQTPAIIPMPRLGRCAMVEPFRYDAFISYRHRQPDKEWADWLICALETYAPPRSLRKNLSIRGLPSRVTRVFRDEDETAAGGDLSQQLKTALEQSRALIVICTRNTPASPWVNQEVAFFESLGRATHVLPLLVEGEPQEAFPPSLLDNVGARIGTTTGEATKAVEPLAADVRPAAGVTATEVKRRALLKLVAGILGVAFDDLYQRDQQRRRRRMAAVAAVVGAMVAGSAGWLVWTRTDAYQTRAVLREGSPLVASALEDDTAAWGRALVRFGRIDEAVTSAQATSDFGGGRVKALLAVADAVATAGDRARADQIGRTAIEGISGFQPTLRAELSLFAAERYAMRERKDEAGRLVAAALEDTREILDTAERLSGTEKLARRFVEWQTAKVSPVAASNPIALAVMNMEEARAAFLAGGRDEATRLALESLATARRVKSPAQRAYVTAYLTDTAAKVGIMIPVVDLEDAVVVAKALANPVAKSQALRQAVQALAHLGQVDTARALMSEISIQDDRDEAAAALIAGYTRAGKADDVVKALEEGIGRNELDRYSLLLAVGEGMADGGRDSIIPSLDPHLSETEKIELRVIVAERLRVIGRDNRVALTSAMNDALDTNPATDVSDPLRRIAAELAATGRADEAGNVVRKMTDAHDRTFALIAIAREALARRRPDQAVALLHEAAKIERTVADADLVAAGLREIGKLLSEAGHGDQAKELFREAIERAATQGETGSSTVADVSVELAKLGELRAARINADRYCTASDRLRVYAAVLDPR